MIEAYEIEEILPHRYPFLLVDRIIELEGNQRAVGIKNVTVNEPFFVGHFPGRPIMPGVLIIEALAQVGGILYIKSIGSNSQDVTIYFMGVDKFKFRKPVLPGDQLRLEITVIQRHSRGWKMRGLAYVGEKLVAEGGITAFVSIEKKGSSE